MDRATVLFVTDGESRQRERATSTKRRVGVLRFEPIRLSQTAASAPMDGPLCFSTDSGARVPVQRTARRQRRDPRAARAFHRSDRQAARSRLALGDHGRPCTWPLILRQSLLSRPLVRAIDRMRSRFVTASAGEGARTCWESELTIQDLPKSVGEMRRRDHAATAPAEDCGLSIGFVRKTVGSYKRPDRAVAPGPVSVRRRLGDVSQSRKS
jgi:hypothetical protein